jgi:hypothetical protein
MLEERPQLRAEYEGAVTGIVMKRLFAHPVAGEQECVFLRVPDGKREHALEALDAVFAVLLVGVDEDLGIAAGQKPVAPGFELRSEHDEVVDFPVVHRPHRAVFVGDRLVPAHGIDDSKPPRAERNRWIDVEAGVVGAAMTQDVRHPLQRGLSLISSASGEEPGDAAHARISFQRSTARGSSTRIPRSDDC